MPNGSQSTSQSVDVLGQRVSTLERSVSDIARQLDTMSSRMASAIEALNVNINTMVSGLRSDFDTKTSTLNDRITTAKTPQWQVIIGALALVVALSGGLWTSGIQPIKEALADIKNDTRRDIRDNAEKIDAVRADGVTKEEWNEARAERKEAISKIEARLDATAAGIVPRGEHQEKWQGADRQRQDMQRQIDDLKAQFGGIYGAHDVIKDMMDRIDRLDRAERSKPPSG